VVRKTKEIAWAKFLDVLARAKPTMIIVRFVRRRRIWPMLPIAIGTRIVSRWVFAKVTAIAIATVPMVFIVLGETDSPPCPDVRERARVEKIIVFLKNKMSVRQ